MLKKLFSIFALLLLLVPFSLPTKTTFAAEGIELYTPYTGISVTPGESISYAFDVTNHTSSIQQVKVSLEDISKDWKYTVTSEGWDLKELSVKPGETKSLTIELSVPLKVEKGDYKFNAVATSSNGIKSNLPMLVTVSEQGTFTTEFTTEQPNLQGHSDTKFEYTAQLKNRTGHEQNYALVAKAPRGWAVDFKADGDSVSSVKVESNATKSITISLTPPTEVEADTYKIPVGAINDSTSADMELEAVITGTYGIELSTPSGKLSENITAGREKTISVAVKNTGTAPLNDVTLSANTPQGWDVSFSPMKISSIEPGKTETVKATIQASDKAIAGDYVVEMTASAPEKSSNAQFRISVKTSLVWGWVGILIIVGVIGGIFYLIRKYGRR
ncbi:COG1470 family protein [Lederbergia citri]|uniref:Alpha-galactosidase NEW3 domain-containing protein n=1 Tax=Lederbergia citri TaxID=2833580 RepID=A0A942TGJ5_9BACI|nr:NEW3 domain-containing protein [Lederbergia citri]MBS4196167.1 hypothetical protein [Lederbergia citri]